MEAANEAARNAVNGIIDFTNDDGMKGKCETKKLYRPWLFKLMHVVDNWRYKRKLNYSFKWTIIIAVLLIPIILIYLLFSIADAIIFFPQFAYHSFKSTKSDIPGC